MKCRVGTAVALPALRSSLCACEAVAPPRSLSSLSSGFFHLSEQRSAAVRKPAWPQLFIRSIRAKLRGGEKKKEKKREYKKYENKVVILAGTYILRTYYDFILVKKQKEMKKYFFMPSKKKLGLYSRKKKRNEKKCFHDK